MRIIQNNRTIFDGLKRITSNTAFDYDTEYIFPDNYGVTLVYSTDDLHLTEKQFEAMKSVLSPGETLYFAQNDVNNPFVTQDCLLLSSDSDLSYTEYCNDGSEEWHYFSTALIFSDSFDWIMIIEETLEGGVGIFAGVKDKIRIFEDNYKQTPQDIRDLVLFHLKDAKRNFCAYDNLYRIISLIE